MQICGICPIRNALYMRVKSGGINCALPILAPTKSVSLDSGHKARFLGYQGDCGPVGPEGGDQSCSLPATGKTAKRRSSEHGSKLRWVAKFPHRRVGGRNPTRLSKYDPHSASFSLRALRLPWLPADSQRSNSFMPQRNHGIDFGRPARGDVAGEQRDDNEPHRNCDESEEGGKFHAVKQA
jgi:hypothetical protein